MNNIRLRKCTAELDMAIIAARKAMGPVDKDQTGNRNHKHANINGVVDCIEDHLADHNLTAYSRRVWRHGNEFFQTVIKHAPTSQKRVETRPFIPDSNPSMTVLQAQGSAETYMRRYALINLLNLRAEDLDKDGADTTEKKKDSYVASKPNGNFISPEMLQEKFDLYEDGEKMKELYCKKYKASELKFVKQEDKKAIWAELLSFENPQVGKGS